MIGFTWDEFPEKEKKHIEGKTLPEILRMYFMYLDKRGMIKAFRYKEDEQRNA